MKQIGHEMQDAPDVVRQNEIEERILDFRMRPGVFRSVGLVSSIMPKVILSGEAIDQRSAENGEGGWATVTEPNEIPTTYKT